MTNLVNYRAVATETCRLLMNRYKGKGEFARPDDSKALAAVIANWMKEFEINNVPADIVPQYVKYVTCESIDFKDFPPTCEQFIKGLNFWSNKNGLKKDHDSKSFDIEFDNFYEEMLIRYEGKWCKSNLTSIDAHKEYWKSCIETVGATAIELRKAKQTVFTCGQFHNFPPNMPSFLDIIQISRSSDEIPLPEIAFDLAVEKRSSEGLNKFIKKARSKFGYMTLINTKDFSIRSRFEAEYRRIIADHISGNAPVVDEEESSFKDESVAQENNKERILERLRLIRERQNI